MAYLNTERPVLPSPQAPYHGMAASGIITVISAVALAIILTTNPTAAGSFTQIAAFGTVGGASLIIFVICSVLACHACRKQREEARLRNERLLQEHDQSSHHGEPPPPDLLSPAKPPRTTEGQPSPELLSENIEENDHVGELNEVGEILQAEEQTIEKLKREVIPPLLDAFRDAVSELLQAHAAITGGAPPDPRAINNLFEEAKELITLNLDKPELYLAELLRCFGRGKNKPSVGLRRLIAAHNSGNPDKIEEVRQQYAAIERGHNLRDVAALFRSGTRNSQILDQLPQLMEGHFSLDDEELQRIGRKLLDTIFGRLKGNRTIDNALTALKQKAPRERCTKSEMENFTKEVEKFMKLAFTEACIPRNELEEMSGRLVEVWIERQLMQNMKKLLGMVARNIRLLPSMFADSVDTRVLFPQIDETFLLSESGDCLGETEEMQKQLIRLQSTINYDRKPENRVAFLVLDEGDTRSYEVLRRENEVVRMCLDANRGNYDLRELDRIGNRRDVQNLGHRLNKRILVVPVSITNHPFKDIRSKLNLAPNWLVRLLYGVFSGFIPGLVKTGVAEMVPALEPREQERFDHFVDSMLNLLMQPIFDGAINNGSHFRKQTVRGRAGKVERRPFEEVITRQGNALADNLEHLVNQREPITFEQIRDVWVESVGNVAEGFKSLMNSRPSINPELRLPPPPPMWVKGAFYTSAAALAVLTVAMAVLLAINPQMGIVGFSLLSGAETISCVLFAVSFYLLNRKQEEQLAKFRLRPPELIVEQPPNGEDSSGGGPSYLRGHIPSVDPLELDIPNRDRSVVSDTSPALPKENEGTHSRVEEDSSDVPQPPIPHATSEEDLSSEDEENDLPDSEIPSPMPDVVQDLHGNLALEPVPVKSLEYIDGFRETLPQLFEAGENFFIAFISAYARSEGKRPDRKTINTIKQAFQTLFQVVDAILKNNVQLFRFTLGALTTSFVEKKLIYPFLQNHDNPVDFVRALPTLLPDETESDSEQLKTTRKLFCTIVEKARLDDPAAQKALSKLYKDLQGKPGKITAAEKRVKEAQNQILKAARKNTNEEIQKALILAVSAAGEENWKKYEKQVKTISELGLKQEDKKIKGAYKNLQKAREARNEAEVAYNGSLMTIIDWLFFKCHVPEEELSKMVANNVAPVIETLRTVIMYRIPNILFQIKDAYADKGMLSSKLVSWGLWFATTFHSAIRNPMKNQINALPLDPRYKRTLTTDGLVDRLIPALTNPIYYATVGNKSIFSSDPHPLRAALKKQMIDLENFALLRSEEAPKSKDWAGYAAAYATILNRFTKQLNGLSFR